MRVYLPTYPEIYASARNAPPGKERLNYADWKLYARLTYPEYRFCIDSRNFNIASARLKIRQENVVPFRMTYDHWRDGARLSNRTYKTDAVYLRDRTLATILRTAGQAFPPAISRVLALERQGVLKLNDEIEYFLLSRLCKSEGCGQTNLQDLALLETNLDARRRRAVDRLGGRFGYVNILYAMDYGKWLEEDIVP